MLTPNHGCVGATLKLTCSETVFASLVMIFVNVDNNTTISITVLLIIDDINFISGYNRD